MYFCHQKTGKIYTFEGLCMIEATGQVGVMYQAYDSDMVIIRPATEFFDTSRFKVVETEPGVTLGELEELFAEAYPDRTAVSTWGDSPVIDEVLETIDPSFADDGEPSSGGDNIFIEDEFDLTEDPNPQLDAEPQRLKSASVAPKPATLQGIEKETTNG